MVVKLFARFREELGAGQVELPLADGATLADILNRVFKGDPPEHFLIAINGRLVGEADLSRIRLKDGDVVDVMPPASGG